MQCRDAPFPFGINSLRAIEFVPDRDDEVLVRLLDALVLLQVLLRDVLEELHVLHVVFVVANIRVVNTAEQFCSELAFVQRVLLFADQLTAGFEPEHITDVQG